MRRRAAAAAAALVAGLVLFATLLPQPAGPDEISFCIRCDERGLADAIANVVLFLPLGALLSVAVGARRAVAWAVVLSLAIEVTQLWVPGRHTALADLVFNAAGGGMGALLVPAMPRLLLPSRRVALLLAGAWSVAAMVVLIGGRALLEPSMTQSTWFGQWTPELGTYSAYEGTVLRARIGDLDIPSNALANSDAVRARLERGEPLDLEFIAGRAPRDVAPIFAIADRDEQQILMVAADREQLVYRYRTRGRAAGLDSPDSRVPDALRRFEPGDTVRVRIVPAWGRRARIEVNGVTREIGIGAADTWGLLLWPTFVARVPALHASMNAAWLLSLVAPALFWLVVAGRARRAVPS